MYIDFSFNGALNGKVFSTVTNGFHLVSFSKDLLERIQQTYPMFHFRSLKELGLIS